jgi:hypothetical protein
MGWKLTSRSLKLIENFVEDLRNLSGSILFSAKFVFAAKMGGR